MASSNGLIPTYQEQSNYNATINANVPQGSPAMAGTGVQKELAGFGDNVSKLGTMLVEHAVKMQQQADDNMIVRQENDFRSSMNDLLYNPNSGLATMKGHKAAGTTVQFDNDTKKIMDEAIQKLPSENMKAKFYERTANWLGQYRNTVAKNEGTEVKQAYLDDSKTNYQNAVDAAMQAPGATAFRTLVLQSNVYKGDLMHFSGMSEETAAQAAQEAYSASYIQMAGVLAESGSTQELFELYEAGKGHVTADAEAKVSTIYNNLKLNIDGEKTAAEYANDAKFKNPDGTLNEQLILEDLAKKIGPNAKKYIEKVVSTGGPVQKYSMPTQGDSITAQVNNLESKWQDGVMDNVGGMLIEMGYHNPVISSAARSPERNSQVSTSGNTSWHVHNDALDVVFDEGQGLSQEQMDALVNKFKSTGHWAEVLYHDYGSGYHLHLGGYDGKFGQNAEKKIEKVEVSAYNEKEYNASVKAITRLARESKARHETELTNAVNQLIPMAKSMTYIGDVKSLVEQNYPNLTAVDVDNVTKQIVSATVQENRNDHAYTRQLTNEARSDQRYAEEQASKAYYSWLNNNTGASAQEKMEKAQEYGLSPKEQYSMQVSLGIGGGLKNQYAWEKYGSNASTFNDVVSGLKLDGVQKANIRQKISAESARRQESGEPPLTEADIESMVQEQGTTVTINKGWFGLGGTDIKIADIPAGWHQDAEGVVRNPDGMAMEYDVDTQSWHVKNA